MTTNQECRTTVLIINYNAGSELLRTVGAVLNRLSPVELLIVDNASTDDSLQQVIASYGGDIEIIRNQHNLGFGPACNQGAESCRSEFLLILNADCQLVPGAIREFEQLMDEQPMAGMVSGVVEDHQGGEQRGSRRRLPTPRSVMGEMLKIQSLAVDQRHLPMPEQAEQVEALSGACMFIRRSAFLNVGGFDTGFGFHFEDLDLMRRLQDEGWKLFLLPHLRIRHIGGISGRKRPLWVSRHKHRGLLRYLRKHCPLNPLHYGLIATLVWAHFVATIPLIYLGWRKP
ncbi:MAG: glycosyltransferase family 2 protein [Wenzhouxiangellaceae bacterium]